MPDALHAASLAEALRRGQGLAAKRDIETVAQRLGLAETAVPVGDDCAAIPDGDGFLLLAIEGFQPGFVAAEPWFAGWCGVMVNLSDVAAMGGRATAVVDALWSAGAEQAEPLLAGLRAAAAAYGVPIVGGHSNLRAPELQLSVAVLGRARRLLSGFAAQPGDVLLAAIDLRGSFRPCFDNFDAASHAPPARLRAALAVLPALAEAGLCASAKDISQAGLVGTALMLAESSRVGMVIDPEAVPRPPGVRAAALAALLPQLRLRARRPRGCRRRHHRRLRGHRYRLCRDRPLRGRVGAAPAGGRRRDGVLGPRRRAPDGLRPGRTDRPARAMKIGLFTHSGNPRGGVVHALSVGEALVEAGHEVSLLAPLGARGFFRPPPGRAVALPLATAGRTGSVERIGQQIDLIVQWLAAPGAPRFDVWHAGDPITAQRPGRPGAPGRDRRLLADGPPPRPCRGPAPRRLAGDRPARRRRAVCCVSQLYQARLAAEFGRAATLVGNGVDTARFSPLPGPADATTRERWPTGGLRLLALGGVEPRKNTLGILEGFAIARRSLPNATLLIAGGASLLDHTAYGARFQAALARLGLAAAVRVCGVVPDDEVPALYRAADMLLSPSLAEGFGLAAVEAMAAGTPSIVAAQPPFTEHLTPGDCLFVDPEDPVAIARAIVEATSPALRSSLRRNGLRVAARMPWRAVADRHLPVFHAMQERQHA